MSLSIVQSTQYGLAVTSHMFTWSLRDGGNDLFLNSGFEFDHLD